MVIRAVVEADSAAVVDVVVEAGLFAQAEAEVVGTLLDDFFSRHRREGHGCLLDVDGDQPVAVAYYQPVPAADRAWNLLMIAVAPDVQGQGRGSRLLDQVEADLRDRGQRLLLVETSGTPAFASARAFYDQRGYQAEARVRDYYTAGDDMLLYRKDLTASAGSPPVPADADSAGGAVPRLRTAGLTDVDRVVGLAVAFYVEDGFATSTEDVRRRLGVLLVSDAARAAVVEFQGQLVGFAVTTSGFGLENGPVAELEDLYVTPDWRRQGLAGRLIEDSASWARARGCTQLELVVAPQGRDVDHLYGYYRTRGFRDDGRRLLSRPL